MEPLAPIPPTPTGPDGRLLFGLWAGGLRHDPLQAEPRRGRARRWSYAAAGDPVTQVGAAVVEIGRAVGVVFAWASLAGDVVTWQVRVPLRRGLWVARTPAGGAGIRSRRGTVLIAGDGGLQLDVPVGRERLVATVSSSGAVTPAVLVTPTAGGGWNSTQKAAGYRVAGELRLGALTFRLEGGGWRDWTAGRQDRHTVWRWAAGAGTAPGGRRVGLNASTGWNDAGAGENVVWWDGRPYPLEVERLGPAGDDLAGPWELAGPGWALSFEPHGARSANEDLKLMMSRYFQPIGRFRGTLPSPNGTITVDELVGVTEDHEARW